MKNINIHFHSHEGFVCLCINEGGIRGLEIHGLMLGGEILIITFFIKEPHIVNNNV